jgi:hypothetical protein
VRALSTHQNTQRRSALEAARFSVFATLTRLPFSLHRLRAACAAGPVPGAGAGADVGAARWRRRRRR